MITANLLTHKCSISILAFYGLLATGSLALPSCSADEKWHALSNDFAEQVNLLGQNLEPGETGEIHVHAPDADELIILPYGISRPVIADRLPNRSTEFIEYLDNLSDFDTRTPALIWMRDGEILSVNYLHTVVGFHIDLKSWELQEPLEIVVAKEKTSPNSFLSLYFVEDGDENVSK